MKGQLESATEVLINYEIPVCFPPLCTSISADTRLKRAHTNIPLIKFRTGLKGQLPRLSSAIVKKLLLFAAISVTETTFPRSIAIQTGKVAPVLN
jgi:hypothetical protein